MRWLILLFFISPVYADMIKIKNPDGSIHLVKTRHVRTLEHVKQRLITREDIKRIVKISSNRHKVDEKLVLAIMQAESSFKPNALSSKGAIGLMQIMKPTGDWLNVKDLNDYRQNIDGGVRYLKFLSVLFKDIKLVVAAYNAGQGAVIANGYKVPPYAETQNYVNTVLRYYKN